nr:MAG TPA: hypothetical protein [Caudoviricetes sp.]DAM97098.1 MAG TPA: hypothetical protein [Caudoviricetes sp.]
MGACFSIPCKCNILRILSIILLKMINIICIYAILIAIIKIKKGWHGWGVQERKLNVIICILNMKFTQLEN